MRRSVFALLFLAVTVLSGASARAGDTPFIVSDIKVDASAASASEASTIAINGGRQQAWMTLIHRLVPQQDWANIPAIDDATLQRMIRGYQISNEQRSTTRYVADVAYTFNAELVRRFLRGANVAYAASAAPPMLVIPMAPGYSPDSAWTAAWAGNPLAGGAVPLILPAGDALNQSVLGPIDFDSATWNDVQPVAARAHAAQVALVLASRPSGGHMTVKIRLLSAAMPQQTLPPVDVAIPAGTQPQKGYGDAMNAAANAIGDAWKARSAIDFNHRSTLTADVHVDSLAEWGAIQQRLAKVPVVMNVNVAAMNIGQARIIISYAGTSAQLNDFLSQAALGLTSRDGVWWLGTQPADGGTGSP